MFGRTVTIDGTEIFVSCVPSTPYSEICRQAARLFLAEEQKQESEKMAREWVLT